MATRTISGASCALVLLIGCILPLRAADPALQSIEPQGGQRGTDVEVVFHGQRFDDEPYQVLLYDTGVEVGELTKVDGKQVKATLKLSPDCRVGRHALRLRTASGLSNLMTFHVGNLPEMKELEPNNALEQAQALETGAVVNGIVHEGDVDSFAIDLVAGERLSAEVEGLRLGRTLFDPVLEVVTADGTVLVESDDQPAAQQDAFVSLVAEQAGRVIVRLRETSFQGSSACAYRLHIGRFPRPVAVYPPAAVAGQLSEVRWIGPTFDESSTSTIDIPQTDDSIYLALATDEQGVAPSGLPMFLGPTKPVLEAEPNSGVKEANTFEAPGVACGIISEANDKDFFRFTMKKDQEWDFRVRARELRSPLDPVLHIYDGEGKYIRGNDDDQGQPDSYLRFKAPADGEYVLDVEDRLQRGREDMVYVVEITQPTAVADLRLDERQRYVSQVINVPQGGRTAAMMTVSRRDFGGPLAMTWDGLPAGCKAEAVPLAANYNRVPVLFTAEPEAAIQASLATISVELTENPRPISSRFDQQTWLVRGRNNVHVWSHFADRAAVAVTQALPYSIRIVEPKAPLVQGGSIELKVVAERNEGFDNSIAVRTIYNPPGVSTNQSRSIVKGQNEALIPITANGSARTGDWKIVFLGRTTINGSVESSTQLATLRIAQPYFDVQIPTITVLQGDTAELTVGLNQRTPFEGDAEIELIRLPPGVTAEKVKVQANSESAVFQLKVAKDARVGRHRGLGCQMLLTIEGEPVRYSQGYVELRIDPATEPLAAR